MKLRFLGGSGTVSGSKFLLEHEGQRILIDCGLFQGVKYLREKNWEEFPIPPDSIDAVLLTHAHLDHSGYLPRLMLQGFKGVVFSTEATFELCKIMLTDSGYLQEEEARYRNKSRSTRHNPALPLYTEDDAKQCLTQFKPVPLNRSFVVGPFEVNFQDAGHILGAASVKISYGEKSIVFSGDLGRYDDLLMTNPVGCPKADYVVVESTYGDSNHSEEDPVKEITKILRKVVSRRGILMIPSFAVGRAQLMMSIFFNIFKDNPDLKVPLYLNSPMATDVTDLYQQFHEEHKLSEKECAEVFQSVSFVNSVEESKALNERSGPMVIISASGMLSGGRILHHLKAFGEDPGNAVLLVGYQAPGTRGAALESGKRELKIHGKYRPINADVFKLDSLSAHADQEDLLRWLKSNDINSCKKVFVAHGEPVASDALRMKVQDNLNLACEVPELGSEVDL